MNIIKENTICGTVVLFGPPNAGKSSLLNVLVGKKISATTHKPQTTRCQIRGIASKKNIQIVFIDIPGVIKSRYVLQSFMRKQITLALFQANIIVLVIDITKYGNNEVISLKELEIVSEIPVVLVLNKIDMLKNKNKILYFIDLWRKRYKFIEILPVSIYKKYSIEDLFKTLSKKFPKGPFMFDKKCFTDSNEKKIIAEFIREKTILELSQELPYKIAVIVDNFNEKYRYNKKKSLIDISAIIYVEEDRQKGIVIGKNGSKIKIIGERARKDIEKFVNCKVMLRLQVKVEFKWTNKKNIFNKLGIF